MENEKTIYKVMAYVKDIDDERAVEVYAAKTGKSQWNMSGGYSKSGTYVHLMEL